MAKTERKDDGRRCYACKGPALNGILPRFEIANGGHPSVVDMHDVCLGSWLMSNPGVSVEFHPGEIK